MSATTYDFGDVRFVEKLAGRAEEPTADVEELNTIADHLARGCSRKEHTSTLSASPEGCWQPPGSERRKC